jgi:quercetin dioxygenase-like cupin family protein
MTNVEKENRMKVEHYSKTEAEEIENVPGVTVRWVVGDKDGAPNFAMRVFEVQPGYATPYHQHAWEHEVFVLAGEGAVRQETGESPIGHGSVVFVPGMEMHQFANRGDSVLRFICVVPV